MCSIEVDGNIISSEGDLIIYAEGYDNGYDPSWVLDTEIQPTALDKAIQCYKNWRAGQEAREHQDDLEMARLFLKLSRIDPSHPEYDKLLQEAAERSKQDRELVMGFSGGIKITQGVARIGNLLRGSGNAKQLHHIATDKSKKFDFTNHPAFKETGIDVSKDVDNLVELAGHRGRHTNAYHQEVQRRLDAVYERFGGTDNLESAVRNELNNMRQELLDGTLDPYGK